MSIRESDKSEWREFFDHLSKATIGKCSEVEVTGLAIGVQIEAEWLTLLDIPYDRNDDVIEIALDEVDHIVNRPHLVFFDLGAGRVAVLQMIDRDGPAQVVKL